MSKGIWLRGLALFRTCVIPKLKWLREGATIRTCGRKKAARLGRLMYAI